MRRATSLALFVHRLNAISIHALHEESDLVGRGAPKGFQISIHALHEESDCRGGRVDYSSPTTFQSTLSMRRATYRLTAGGMVDAISIHALHEESDFGIVAFELADCLFQSTLSMRRATE